MAHKFLAQILIVGGKIIGNALVQAFKQEFQAGAVRAARASAQGAKNATQSNVAVSGMTVEEAKMILNTPEMCPEKIDKSYQYLFEINDKKAGGSFYLQSKVFRAKERLDLELKKTSEKPKEET